MENTILIAIVLLILAVGFCLYLITQVLNATKKIREDIANIKVTANESDHSKYELTYSSLKKGSMFPEIEVLDPATNKTSQLIPHAQKDTLILLTGVGCKSCEQTLSAIIEEKLNFEELQEHVIILSFHPPQLEHDPTYIQNHLALVNKANSKEQYVINEEALQKLRVNDFPILLRLAPNGTLISAFAGNMESFVRQIHLRRERVLVS